MINILNMRKDELKVLNPDDVNRLLTDEETLYIFLTLGYAWFYDYDAATAGRLGLHALLKSLRHSDGFINAKGCLEEHANIRRLFALQIAMRIKEFNLKPDYIAGVPTAATELGKEVAEAVGVENAKLIKDIDGCIKLAESLEPGKSILVIDDICTRGTGFTEAVTEIKGKYKDVEVILYNFVIVNRGGLSHIPVGASELYKVSSVAERRINDWTEEECPLCQKGSKPIKPKISDENWEKITTSQAA